MQLQVTLDHGVWLAHGQGLAVQQSRHPECSINMLHNKRLLMEAQSSLRCSQTLDRQICHIYLQCQKSTVCCIACSK